MTHTDDSWGPITAQGMTDAFKVMRKNSYTELALNALDGTWERVVTKVAIENGVTLAGLLSPKRDRRLAHPRQDAYRILNKEMGLSLSHIGTIFDRDHTTIMHGVKASEART